MSFTVCIGLSSLANAYVNSETRSAATLAGAASVTEISFTKKSTDLSRSAKKEIKEAILSAGRTGEIREVRVAAWADQEYPPKGVDLAASQIDLAEKRADRVQSYLKQTLNVNDVVTINMAKRPSGVQNALNTPNAQAKNSMENTGAAPTSDGQTGLFGLKGKSSEVVVMIFYKK
jgi:outer membrane protein OmpA-like peptidoglycan-associated protein